MELEKILTPMLVVAVALMRSDGRILMQQRHLSAEHGGLWEFPGGKVEPGETPEIAAVRELEEELAVDIDEMALEPVSFASGVTAGEHRRPLVILLYACRTWQGAPHAREAEAVAWHAPSTIRELRMPPLDYPLADALCGFLGDKAI